MADELEVTVLGCGYGESIVVHRGENDWFVIDSFIHRTTRDGGVVERASAALAYLKSIDVGPARVGEVFLSHYHEDHSGHRCSTATAREPSDGPIGASWRPCSTNS